MFPEEHFDKKNFSARSYIFISFQGFAENILTWRKTPWSSGRHFTWPVECFEEECLGETKNSWVLWNEQKISVFWRNSFSRVVKTAFRVSRETLWEKCTFSRKKYDFESIFWHWVKNFLFRPKTSPGVSKLKCTCPNTILNKFPEKNHFHLSLRNLLRKFWIAQKLGFCQEGLLRLQRNISRKHFLEKTKRFLTFRLWTRIFRVSGKTKLTDLPKLHSMCPEIHFQKTDFFSIKKQFFCSIPRLWERNFRSLFATFGHGCRTPILRVQSPYWNKSGIRFIFNFPEFWRKLWFALKYSRLVRKDLTLQENNFLGETIFLTSTALREKSTVVRRNMTSRFATNALHATTEAIWRRRLFFFHKNITLGIFSDSERRTSKFFSNFFAKGCKNRTLCFQKKILKKNVSARSYNFFIFSWFCWEHVDLTENSMVVKKAFYVTSWKFRGRIFGRNQKFLNFVKWAKIFSFFAKQF